MRIAFISTMAAVPWGGSEVLWQQTALAALAQGHAVLASVYRRDPLPPQLQALAAAGAELHLRPLYSPSLATRLTRRVQTALHLLKPLSAALAAFRPDIICVSQGGNFEITQMAWLREALVQSGVPFCFVCHNYDASQLPAAEMRQTGRQIFARAARVFFVSQEQAHVSQRQLATRLPNAELVKNPVNLPAAELLPWPTSAEPQLAIVAGVDINRKGQDIALEVLSTPRWQQRAWHLNIYGDGPDHEYVVELLALYKLQARVTLHGNVADVTSIWRQNHLLLVPSRREAAPLVVMEAMLCGRPVVGTAVGSIAEWLTEGQTGFVAAAATVPLFEAALEQAWQAQSSWEAMGSNAHEWAGQYADLKAAETFLTRLQALAAS
ncbi:MAG TPA: glycosyltransferase family 4 protein [Hymenobacter sp.]|uniref:glycosyltransferase family 4 protein n=1 Tax=Hymenobacter sp. TaxID=1898978 RepID=UPI002D7F70F1|nr:glycosyltransferase family 4 protein [Hymenobacter sp.]HET9503950.1 glycosyltransferase family 4 protein [Hymenobacter sp.]